MSNIEKMRSALIAARGPLADELVRMIQDFSNLRWNEHGEYESVPGTFDPEVRYWCAERERLLAEIDEALK